MNSILILLFSILLGAEPILVERAFYVMGTVLEFKLYCEDKEFCNNAISDAYSEVKRLDDMLSDYKDDSKLAEVNSHAGMGKIGVPSEFVELTERSIFFSTLTDGAFDITVGKLMKLWRSAQRKNTIPHSGAIGKTLSECVGYQKIMLNAQKNQIELGSRCISIDFGGIGKGYAVDRAVRVLRGKGIKSGLINFSGKLYAIGAPPGEKGWSIGVQHPRSKGEVLTLIKVKDMGVSTSGDYERYFEINGKRFSHILDPRTGYPVETVPSATVIAGNATDADALSTAISVMGKDESLESLAKFDRAGVMIVTLERNALSLYKNAFFQEHEAVSNQLQ
jgi:thiamine biosynthesis lipoprotein ApbE